MEAILLAGGRAERLGEAAGGRPKALVEIAGRPLAAYQLAQLAAAGVTRVIVSCAAGQEEVFERELKGLGPEIVVVGEPEALGRGGGVRFAAQAREETGALYVLNGDELIDVDLVALADAHSESRRCRDDRRRTAPGQLRRRGRGRRGPCAGLRRDAGAPVLGERRRVRAGRRNHRAVPGEGRPRAHDVPRAGRRRQALRVPPRGGLADGQHAEGPARGR